MRERSDIMPNPILITGCARSGTSMVAGLVRLSGAYSGNIRKESHTAAHHENRAIVEHLVKPYLRSIDADPKGQKPLPDRGVVAVTATPEKASEWRLHIYRRFLADGYSSGPWFYKGAKMCLIWPMFHAAFPESRWIIVRRPDDAVIESCLRAPFMGSYKGAQGWQGWVDEHLAAFNEMHEAGMKIREVWSDRVAGGDFTEIKDAVEWCGLTFDEDKAREFVDPKLYHGAVVNA